ncbi:unnamed protein product [Schistocephalus solidus]|uniref:C2H2-type domain-containing protein n=1 Tax=Schistocephalus solidus TaxID=70667 RepID=A0A183TC92_SCHSO|nr:unnamed protein product [Schistocephalus solidus]
MHQQSDNFNFYVKFCRLYFGLPNPHSWHQFYHPNHHSNQIPMLINCYPHHRLFRCRHHQHHQLCGLSPKLSSMRPHIHVTHRPGRSLATGEPVPGAPTHSRDRRLHCAHCPRAFTRRMGLFGHMRIHVSGIYRNANNTDTPCTPFAPAIPTAIATPATMNDIPQPLPISPAHTAPATSTHASACLVTCESIARRLVN